MFRRQKSEQTNEKPIEGLQQLPIIISGTGRSGTSILLGAVAAHPKVHNGPDEKGEAPFITHFLKFLSGVDKAPYGAYVNRNYRCGIEKRNELFMNLLRDINSPSAEANTKADYWPAKIHLDEEEYEKFNELAGPFPVVKIHRNPISVVDSSLNFHGFQHLSFEQICRRWVKGNRDMDYFRTTERTAVVSYEELSKDPHKVFKEVFELIELPHSDKPADFFKNTKINSAYKSKKKPSVEERWSSWEKEQQKQFKEICGPLMKKLGYSVPK